MKKENASLRKLVSRLLKEHYDIDAIGLVFHPIGEESFAYKVKAKGGEKYFVKLSRNLTISPEVLGKLFERPNSLPFVIPLVRTTHGRFSVEIREGILTVYPYIEGKSAPENNSEFDESLVKRILEIMATIHNLTDSVKDLDLPVESFEENFTELLKEIETLAKLSDDRKVVGLFQKEHKMLKQAIERHIESGESFRKESIPFVLTHGDITGLNIMITSDGVKLLDWEGVMFAPAERDLNFLFSNKYFPQKFRFYADRTGKTKINRGLINYYRERWALESILDNFKKLLTEESKFIDRKEAIQEILEYMKEI